MIYSFRNIYHTLIWLVVLLAVPALRLSAQEQAPGYAACQELENQINDYYSQAQWEQLHIYCDSLMQLAQNHQLMKFYYSTASTKSLSYLRQEDISQAFEVCEKTLKRAYRDQDALGIFVSRIMMARFFNSCKMNARAMDECDIAAQMELDLPDHNFGTALFLGLQCSLESEYWQRGRDFLDKYKQYVDEPRALTAMLAKGLIMDFWMKDSVRFEKDMQEYQQLIAKHEDSTRETDAHSLKVIQAYQQGYYQQALKEVQLVNEPLRYSFKSLLFFATHQQDSLQANMQQRNVYFDHKAQYIYDSDVRKFEVELINQELISENQELSLSRDNLRFYLRIFLVAALIIIVIVGGIWFYTYAQAKKKLLASLEEKNQTLERINALKSIFVQNMGHEVRTPMNAICGFSQLLADPEMADQLTPEERKEFGDIITSSTEMLTTLVNDILDLGDIESGKYRISKDWCCINDICSKSISTIRHRVPEHLVLNFETDYTDQDTIYTDPARVQQILVNFLTNAIKHTDEGSITLKAAKLGTDSIRFSVTDTGEGIPADKAEAIFERFEKLNTTRQGTGLGLPICRSLAGCLGGKVYLDTTYPGPGCRFHYDQPIS